MQFDVKKVDSNEKLGGSEGLPVVGYLSGTVAINGYLPFEHAVFV
jgi:hypothetical protein